MSSHHWLSTLQKMHALVDRAVSISRKEVFTSHGLSTACAKGCNHCCRHVIPASAPELAGALWHLGEHVPGAVRSHVRENLHIEHRTACPFLHNEVCSVYPMRFMACRQFMVYDHPCSAGENVWETRPQDLLLPAPGPKMEAFALLATLYGVELQHPPDPVFLRRFVMDVSAPLHMWNLNTSALILAELEQGMLHYPKRTPEHE